MFQLIVRCVPGLREEVHGEAQETDRTERKEDYRKEIAMLKKEIQELKNQREEFNKQVSEMREEMRRLREDRESYRKQLPALEKQLTQRGEQQSLEETPSPSPSPLTTAINPSSPPSDSYSQTQPQIVLLMDSNGKPAASSPSHSHEHQQEQHPDSQSYAEAVSRSLIHSNTSTVNSQQASSPSRDLRNIQHMLTLLCSHLMASLSREDGTGRDGCRESRDCVHCALRERWRQRNTSCCTVTTISTFDRTISLNSS
ncbi:hypothetical protein DPX16_18766 [Anabarilius grahami]|uniref:Uncharacterized protein n=1 Tax=Anabarilius grahami TaxID=495550 RepID=A0A3N0Y207_ANAGA|nr:hypothetical protein DPX16_18766 [Anabarilius grahami]